MSTEERVQNEELLEAEPSEHAEQPAGAAQPGGPGFEPPFPAAPRTVVPRWIQVVGLTAGLFLLWEAARAAKSVVIIFVVAAVIALILNPAVAFLKRRHLPRGLAVLTVYVAFFLTLVGIGYLLATPISNGARSLSKQLPSIVNSANHSLDNVQSFFDRNGINITLKDQGKTALQTLQSKVLKGSSSIVSFGGDLLKRVVTGAFNLILVFVLSVYMLIYGERIGGLVRKLMPPGNGTPEDDYPSLVQHAVSSYLRGQLLFSLIMGFTAGISLYIFGLLGLFPQGRSLAWAFGVFFGVMELIPYVGPVLGALPPILVALATHPINALWLALLFLAIQQLEGHFVTPQIFGRTLRINPILVIGALLFGGTVYGVVGALLALPIAAVLRETAIYLQRHLVLEPWGSSAPPPPR